MNGGLCPCIDRIKAFAESGLDEFIEADIEEASPSVQKVNRTY